jgi:two-component system alkaline phosphatase synthesis response regulator PhoP
MYTRKKVLIAEDQPDGRQLLLDILEGFEDRGVQVFAASDGLEAMRLALSEKPDLLLLDVMMPGMDGFQVCQKVKSDPALAKAYIIMLTARWGSGDRERAAVVGADEYLTKPYEIDQVSERIEAALGIAPLR